MKLNHLSQYPFIPKTKMLETEILDWLQTISSWYIILPLIIVILRWKTHDVFRRRVAYYVIFNICFTSIGTILSKLNINYLFLFYLASPMLLWIVFSTYQSVIGEYKIWKLITILSIAFTVFVVIDMFFIEDFRNKFPNYVYPPQEIIELIIIYYYLYIFSKEARRDFSSLWISIGIGSSALITLIVLLYNPYLGFVPNTLGYFIWAGLGSFSSIISYSCVAYGLYIAQSKIELNALNKTP